MLGMAVAFNENNLKINQVSYRVSDTEYSNAGIYLKYL
jgi:hypothetical protein